MKNKLISRNLSSEQISVREDKETGKRYIEAYAIVFNQRSRLIREWGEVFYEVIESTAPDNVLRDTGLNTIATVDHDRAKMLGRLKSGTLELVKDDHGLRYIIEVPDTTLGNDMYEMVKRGDYSESSFIFTIAEKGVRYDKGEEIPVRYVSDFSNLYDVAIVIDGAYATGKAQARAEQYAQTQTEPETLETRNSELGAIEHDILNKEIEIIKL